MSLSMGRMDFFEKPIAGDRKHPLADAAVKDRGLHTGANRVPIPLHDPAPAILTQKSLEKTTLLARA
jgi:hypothetical protein